MLTKDDIEEMSRGEMVTRIVELQEQKRYSAFDLNEFAEWVDANAFRPNLRDWYMMDDGEPTTITQLRELWEVETGRKEATE